MKALLVVFALVVIAIFVVRQPDPGDAVDTAGRGTGSADGGSLASRCTVHADVPVVRGGTLVATARYRCARSDGGVDATVNLQMKVGANQWQTVDGQPVSAAGADTTRRRPESARTATAGAPCAPGTFRTSVGGTVSNGDRSFPVLATSDPIVTTCPVTSPTDARRRSGSPLR